MEQVDVVYEILEKETGEIIQSVTKNQSLIIRNNKDVDTLYDNKFGNNRQFTKVFNDSLPIMSDLLLPKEFVFAFNLIPYVSYKDCIIRLNPESNGRMLTLKELAVCMKYSYDSCRKYMSILTQKGVVAKCRVGNILPNDECQMREIYIVNPYIYFKGQEVNRTVSELFRDTIWNPKNN